MLLGDPEGKEALGFKGWLPCSPFSTQGQRDTTGTSLLWPVLAAVHQGSKPFSSLCECRFSWASAADSVLFSCWPRPRFVAAGGEGASLELLSVGR